MLLTALAAGAAGCADDPGSRSGSGAAGGTEAGELAGEVGGIEGAAAGGEEVGQEGEGEPVDCLCVPGAVRCDTDEISVCAASCLEWTSVACPPGQACQQQEDVAACVSCVCEPGAFECLNANIRRDCLPDCSGWDEEVCQAGQTCIEGLCQERICTPGETKCGDVQNVERCNNNGTAWEIEACPGRSLCTFPPTCGVVEAECRRILCEPRETRCNPELGDGQVEFCQGGGTCWVPQDCPEQTVCHRDRCRQRVCEADQTVCDPDEQDRLCECNDSGTARACVQCPPNQVCLNDEVFGGPSTCEPCECRPASTRCGGPNSRQVCREDCSGWDTVVCEEEQVCGGANHECRPVVCAPGTTVCVDLQTRRECPGLGDEPADIRCPPSTVCIDGRCRPEICEPGERRCLTRTLMEECDVLGYRWREERCPVGEFCEAYDEEDVGDPQQCRRQICQAGVEQQCQRGADPDELDNNIIEVCSPGGTFWAEANCGQGFLCEQPPNEDAECEPVVCIPGERRCLDPVNVGICNERGTGFDSARVCDNQGSLQTCRLGRCETACERAASLGLTEGCEFILPGPGPLAGGGGGVVRVMISNPSAVPTLVELRPHGAGDADPVDSAQIGPGEGAEFVIDPALDAGAGVRPGAWRVESAIPVFAYVLTGFDAAGDLTAGGPAAAMLPPSPFPAPQGGFIRAGWGTRYTVGTWPPVDAAPGLLTIVAGRQAATVQVLPSVDLAEGPAVAATAAGEFLVVDLEPGDVLYLETQGGGAVAGDLTGTDVIADAPVLLFAGTSAARVPADGGGGDPARPTDAIAHHIPPRRTWGTVFVGARTEPRGDGSGPDFWRVVAGSDRLDVETLPDVGGAEDLAVGEHVDLQSDGDVLIRTNGGALVLRMMGSHDHEDNGIGDTAVALVPPQEQVSGRGWFNLPDFLEQTYLDVTNERGRAQLDGQFPLGVADFRPVGNGQYLRARRSIPPGVHSVSAERGFVASVTAFGGEAAFSFAITYEANNVFQEAPEDPPPPPPGGEGEGEGEAPPAGEGEGEGEGEAQ